MSFRSDDTQNPPVSINRKLARLLTTHMTPLQAGLGVVGLVVAASVIVLLAARLTRLARGGVLQELTAEDPRLETGSWLEIELTTDQALTVRVAPVDSPPHPEGRSAVGPALRVTLDGDGQSRLLVELPDGIVTDLFRWDETENQWAFVPVTASDEVWAADGQSGIFARLTPNQHPPQLGITSADANFKGAAISLLPGGTIRADGGIDVATLADPPLNGNKTALPLVSISDSQPLAMILADDSVQTTHAAAITTLAKQYDGVALAYGPLAAEQTDRVHDMIGLVSAALPEDKMLAIVLPIARITSGGWNTQGYDYARVGAAADMIIVGLPTSPRDWHANGAAGDYLEWVANQVDRSRVYVRTTALSLDEWGQEIVPVSYQYALGPLSAVSLRANGQTPEEGETLYFELAGGTGPVTYDAATGLTYYEIIAAGGEHTVWIADGPALVQRLDWLKELHLGGVLFDGLTTGGVAPGTISALEARTASNDAAEQQPLTVRWEVRDENGKLVHDEQINVGEPLKWTAMAEGGYTVRAIVGQEVEEREETSVWVGVTPTPAPAPTVTPVPLGVAASGEVPGGDPNQLPAIPEGMPAPVYPPGQAAFGRFELGGQVNKVIRHPDYMHMAGMEWVKFQLTWSPGQDPAFAYELIELGRSQDFKVLLSIVGATKRPQTIDVPAYLDFLRKVAYAGPDAIEVWNEPNYYFEWPQGQMHGGDYVRDMLAPAYNAIKEVNPNIMVISGALLPTGLYFGEGGCSANGYGCDDWLYLQQMAEAGAANYMDCVGVHYNAGATPPSVSEGHPADPGYGHYSWYFSPMLNLYAGTFGHPVCFTELGYLSPESLGSLPDLFSWGRDISVDDQARWLAEAASISRQSDNVRMLIVWNVDFLYWGDDDPKAGYAIVRPNGSCPACEHLSAIMGQ